MSKFGVVCSIFFFGIEGIKGKYMFLSLEFFLMLLEGNVFIVWIWLVWKFRVELIFFVIIVVGLGLVFGSIIYFNYFLDGNIYF